MAEPDNDEPTPARVSGERRATEFLANERTFLAWIRTSIAVVSLGFVVAKFGIWISELARGATPQLERGITGASIPTGMAMIAFGGLLAILAAWRYHVVNRDIEQGEVKPDRGLVVLVTVVVAALSIVLIVYMLVSANRL